MEYRVEIEAEKDYIESVEIMLDLIDVISSGMQITKVQVNGKTFEQLKAEQDKQHAL